MITREGILMITSASGGTLMITYGKYSDDNEGRVLL